MVDHSGLKFKQEIQQMMFVSGETAEPSIEVLTIMEEIIRSQVIEMLTTSSNLAARRGSRFITNNDLIFQFRHDTAKVSRVRNFLAWKDLRKNVKSEDTDLAGAEEAGTAGGGDEIGDEEIAGKIKKEITPLPWDISSLYNQTVPMELAGDDEVDEMDKISLERLRKEDERTKGMTRAEYITWSECRQASFTRGKIKRFREWAGIGTVAECKANEDVIDILGFFICEMVQIITERALVIQRCEDEEIWGNGIEREDAGKGSGSVNNGLFCDKVKGKMAVETKHIRRAFEDLQCASRKGRVVMSGKRGRQRESLRLI